jgi:hypothetical protein
MLEFWSSRGTAPLRRGMSSFAACADGNGLDIFASIREASCECFSPSPDPATNVTEARGITKLWSEIRVLRLCSDPLHLSARRGIDAFKNEEIRSAMLRSQQHVLPAKLA